MTNRLEELGKKCPMIKEQLELLINKIASHSNNINDEKISFKIFEFKEELEIKMIVENLTF